MIEHSGVPQFVVFINFVAIKPIQRTFAVWSMESDGVSDCIIEAL